MAFDRTEDILTIDKGTLPHLMGRSIRRFSLPDQLNRGRANMMGVVGHLDQPLSKNLLIVGTGRCGTTWLSRTLEAINVDTPHECVGANGTVSCLFYKDHEWYPHTPWARRRPGPGRRAHVGERLSDFTFEHVVHLVRHPLDTEASIRGMLISLVFYWSSECGVLRSYPWDAKPRLLRNLYYWLDVVRHCERMSCQTVALNKVDDDSWWYEMLERARLPRRERSRIPPKNRSTGFKKKQRMTWSEVESQIPGELYRELRELTRELKLEQND